MLQARRHDTADELVQRVPPGHLHSPYQDYAELAKEHELVEKFPAAGLQRMSWRHWRRRLLPGFDSRRLVLG